VNRGIVMLSETSETRVVRDEVLEVYCTRSLHAEVRL
jgi:hypothetical protein